MKRNALIAPLCSLALLACATHTAKAQAVWPADNLSPRSEEVSTQYAAGSVLVSGFNVASILNNTGSPSSSPKWGYLGVLGGVLGMGLGGASLVESNEAHPLAIANIAIGALTTVTALSAIRHAKREQPEEHAAAGHMPVHFAAGVVGRHEHGLGVQLTF
jgi:predicted lipid-binding transport protein (Tim44 family)